MADLVVTVPQRVWIEWLREGNLAGDQWNGDLYSYDVWQARPPILPGERVYVVAWGHLRGYAPLVSLEHVGPYHWGLIRGGGAVACTIPQPVRGFRGWLKRWWGREQEIPFPNWRTEGVPERELVKLPELVATEVQARLLDR